MIDVLLIRCFVLSDTVDGPRFVSISPTNQQLIAHGNVMVCASEGNPHPEYHWTAALSESTTSTTFPGAELVVDVCKLAAWNERSEKKNMSGTTRLTLTCQAQNTVRGQLRTVIAKEVYNLALLTNINEICGEFMSPFAETFYAVTSRVSSLQNITLFASARPIIIPCPFGVREIYHFY